MSRGTAVRAPCCRAVNDGNLRPRMEDLLAVAAELVAVHGREPGDDVAEALRQGLQSATRVLHVPIGGPVLNIPQRKRSGSLRAAQGGCARRWTIADAVRAPRVCGRWR